MASFISGLIGIGTGFATGGALIEPQDAAYQRQVIEVASVSAKVAVNSNLISYGPTQTMWGSLNSLAIYDANGDIAWSGSLTGVFEPGLNTPVVILPGQLTLTFP